jgi:hypothetical protein
MTDLGPLTAHLTNCALELSKDDPEILTADWDGFARVMWSDRDHEDAGVTREEYEEALLASYRRIKSGEVR